MKMSVLKPLIFPLFLLVFSENAMCKVQLQEPEKTSVSGSVEICYNQKPVEVAYYLDTLKICYVLPESYIDEEVRFYANNRLIYTHKLDSAERSGMIETTGNELDLSHHIDFNGDQLIRQVEFKFGRDANNPVATKKVKIYSRKAYLTETMKPDRVRDALVNSRLEIHYTTHDPLFRKTYNKIFIHDTPISLINTYNTFQLQNSLSPQDSLELLRENRKSPYINTNIYIGNDKGEKELLDSSFSITFEPGYILMHCRLGNSNIPGSCSGAYDCIHREKQEERILFHHQGQEQHRKTNL